MHIELISIRLPLLMHNSWQLFF